MKFIKLLTHEYQWVSRLLKARENELVLLAKGAHLPLTASLSYLMGVGIFSTIQINRTLFGLELRSDANFHHLAVSLRWSR